MFLFRGVTAVTRGSFIWMVTEQQLHEIWLILITQLIWVIFSILSREKLSDMEQIFKCFCVVSMDQDVLCSLTPEDWWVGLFDLLNLLETLLTIKIFHALIALGCKIILISNINVHICNHVSCFELNLQPFYCLWFNLLFLTLNHIIQQILATILWFGENSYSILK